MGKRAKAGACLEALVEMAIPLLQEAERQCPRTGPGAKPEIPDWLIGVLIMVAMLKRKKTKAAQFRFVTGPHRPTSNSHHTVRQRRSRMLKAEQQKFLKRPYARRLYSRRKKTVEPFNQWFKSLFELDIVVWKTIALKFWRRCSLINSSSASTTAPVASTAACGGSWTRCKFRTPSGWTLGPSCEVCSTS